MSFSRAVVVAQQKRDGPGSRAVLAPARVRGVVLQPDLLVDHLDQGVERDRVPGVCLGQLQDTRRELVDTRGDLLSLRVGRGLVEAVRRLVELLEERLVLLYRRARL